MHILVLDVALRANMSPSGQQQGQIDPGIRRRLFAGFRPLSVITRGRLRPPQHRSISLPESKH